MLIARDSLAVSASCVKAGGMIVPATMYPNASCASTPTSTSTFRLASTPTPPFAAQLKLWSTSLKFFESLSGGALIESVSLKRDSRSRLRPRVRRFAADSVELLRTLVAVAENETRPLPLLPALR